MEIRLSLREQAYQAYVLGLKLYWTQDLFRTLREDYAAAGIDQRARDVDEAERLMRGNPRYQYFAWLERHLQQMKYVGAAGILPAVLAREVELKRALEHDHSADRGTLDLRPALALPEYYTGVDFHEHPGGVWSDDVDSFAYELGARTTTPTHTKERDLHNRLTAAVPAERAERVLDMGCGFGKSTLPFKERYPAAEVVGIDLSAPNLKLGHLRAEARGVPLTFSQQNAEETDFPAESFDVVTSTMVIHELPPDRIEKMFREAYRLLKPGGWFVNLDFYDPPGGTFGRLLHYGHSIRNNEPFMRPWCELDADALQRRIGFRHAEHRPFEEKDGALAEIERPTEWRFPWTIFLAQK